MKIFVLDICLTSLVSILLPRKVGNRANEAKQTLSVDSCYENDNIEKQRTLLRLVYFHSFIIGGLHFQ